MPIVPDVLFLSSAIAVSPLTPDTKLLNKNQRLSHTQKGLKKWIDSVPNSVEIILVENTGYANYFKYHYGNRIRVIDAPTLQEALKLFLNLDLIYKRIESIKEIAG